MKRTIIGSGIYNLDTIVIRDYPKWPHLSPFTDRVVLEEVGGTCGNVMCILAWMGWDARPLACLDDSPEGLKVAEGLRRYGCDCRHVTNSPGGGTTLLRCTHKKTPEGAHVMSVRAGSPGGSRFPKRRYLRARDEATAFLESLKEAPAVFFFDDPSAGNRLIAKELRERGSLIYFEPSRLKSRTDMEAVALSDIIKFSDENIPDASFADAFNDKVFIQTLGAGGVRLKYKREPWHTFEAEPATRVVDTEGAGDWFTASFIESLAALRVKSMKSLYSTSAWNACAWAMNQATKSVAHMGSKGLILAKKGPVVEDCPDCSWCNRIMKDAARGLQEEVLLEMGTALYVIDWDLDRICLAKEPAGDGNDPREAYTIRTWDFHKSGMVEWTLFKIIDDEDGSSHGEILTEGQTDIPDE